MKLFANILTWLVHPVVLAIPGVFLVTFFSTGSIPTSFYWTFISIIFSGIVAAFVLHGVKRGFFNNIDVSNRKQRIILYPFVIFVVLLFALFVYLFSGPKDLIAGSILFICALFIFDAINTKIKASVHVAAASSFIVGLVHVYGGIFYLALILIPLVAWARVTEKKHTIQETITGAFFGILLTVLAIYVVQFLV